jgi:hypothetical protein
VLSATTNDGKGFNYIKMKKELRIKFLLYVVMFENNLNKRNGKSSPVIEETQFLIIL